ncbi:MAG: transglutaminase domain-containing protein [Cyclobacteriaceae bacterium]|nr:transglutaminase domain-containing protein [Cyclobacteriaceae bacterium]
MKKVYPDESAIYLNRNKIITLDTEGELVTATATVEEKILFLKDRPDNATDMVVYGSHFQEIENLKAFTSVWDKTKYREIPLSGLTRQQEGNSSIFFDDSYFYRLSFPAGHEGNQASWSYSEVYRDARFLTSFYFQSFLPQLSGLLVLRVPKNIEINWQIVNDPEKRIKFRMYEKNGYRNYEWKAEHIPKVKWEDNSPSGTYHIPIVLFQVAELNVAGEAKSILANLSDLHKWYFQFIEPILEDPNPDLIEEVKNLVKPGDTELEIVRKVFYWVQDNIRYIAFEDGMRGFVPHKPSYVFEKRYGDCKDVTSLIVGMLKSIGIRSYFTWVGSRDIAFQYSNLPSPAVDNHMIATYISPSNEYFFLDGAGDHSPFGYPSAMIQGKEALIVFDDTSFEIKKIPEIDASLNRKIDTVYLSISTDGLTGVGKAYLTGFQKVSASYDLNKTSTVKEKENLELWIRKGNNKFVLHQYEIKNLSDKDSPLMLDYSFSIHDYITYIDSEIYVNLNLEKIYNNQLINFNRKLPIENDYKFSTHNCYILNIPDGYELEYVPDNSSLKTGVLDFSVTYHHINSTVVVDFKIANSTLLLTADQFDEWNKVVHHLGRTYKESIILKRKSS